MRQTHCPLCQTPPPANLLPLSVHTCASCGIRWTYLPEDIEAEKLYEDEVYSVVDNRRSIFEKIIFREAKKVLGKARRIYPKAKSLLDFGSGKGQFLKVAQDLGWKGLGVETAQERARFAAEKYGVSVISEFYHGGKIGSENYGLITLNHVLEHLPEPLDLLQKLLDQNAQKLVYIEVPRADSWQAQIAGGNWMHWDIPKHLTHWTEEILVENVEKLGFRKVATRSYSIHLGVLGMLQAFLSRLGFRENLILRLKRKKTIGLMLIVGLVLPFAWILEVVSVPFGKSGIVGVYFEKHD
ncbi:class I SAM-dependent methyltransferase [Algoriphagus marincola]|uniref:Class I SAM-dependent methyltransferase n=1 Tax=Algoriphagus marincola TaxID=264027 RepID=A0ABS7N794_9BACT|nr:class I SAM-dependent methyltransferase [Algoriphagus marincola]MBY5951773.1 class I SAM-dependent methyltransferase [Algoriphagus marincola]